jgi:hypothetical protein
MIERHQDYQLTVATVPPGGLIGLPLQLDTDAPFLARLVKSRNIGLNGFRFQTPKQVYQTSGIRTDTIPRAPGGLANPRSSHGATLYPEMVYPIGATILCDIGNATGEPITNARLLFRGSKLFPDGAIVSPTYPPNMSVLPFTYPVLVKQVAAVTSTPIRNMQLQIKTDADFVLRYGVCDPFTLGIDGGDFNPFNFSELYVTLRDEWYKAFSNGPIHIDDLFGQGQPQNFQGAGANNDDVLFFPGLFTPEIYIERNHSIYFDIVRNDPGSGPVDLHFRFQGMKVFHR